MIGRKGLLITLEGGEGAGKSTQARRLREFLEGRGHNVVMTREPGGTVEAEKIRDLLVQRDGGNWTPMAECLLFFAARQMHVETLIKPVIAEGRIVICDRFTDSTRAYQGYGHGFPLETIESLNAVALQGFEPDLTFILDLPADAGLRRSLAQKAGSPGREATEDRFEKLDMEFHERIRKGFLDIAAQNPARCRVIDATRSADEIFEDLRAIVVKAMS